MLRSVQFMVAVAGTLTGEELVQPVKVSVEEVGAPPDACCAVLATLVLRSRPISQLAVRLS